MRIRINFQRLAEMVKKDRAELSLNQPEYARRLGLTQPQISRLESGTLRRLTHEVAETLKRRVGELPTSGEVKNTEGERTAESPAPYVRGLEWRTKTKVLRRLAHLERDVGEHVAELKRLLEGGRP